MPDALTPFLVAAGMLLGLVAFLNVVLSPLIAAFAAGAGFGAMGVLAILRAGPRRGR